MDKDLLEEVWEDRPSLPKSKIFIHDVKYCGKTAKRKVKSCKTSYEGK